MSNKRSVSFFVSIVIMLGYVILPKTFIKAEADITPPTLTSITIDKKIVTSGETINLTVNAQDDISGVKSGYVIYEAPQGNQSKSVMLSRKSDGSLSGSLTIGQYDAIGTWKIEIVSLVDSAGNGTLAYNLHMPSSPTLDLSNCNFEVKDATPKEDVNKDGVIDVKDIELIVSEYNCKSMGGNWNADLDINSDDIIDIYDVVKVSSKIN